MAGAQLSLYAMSDDFVAIIESAIAAIEPFAGRIRRETDDLSTLVVAEPHVLFAVSRAMFTSAAQSGSHCVLSALYSRGCPGESDAGRETVSDQALLSGTVEERIQAARTAVAAVAKTGVEARCQFALYPLGNGSHMDEINGCIAFLRESSVFDRTKNYCTKLRGDAGPLFETLHQAFVFSGDVQAHVTLDVTVSANSPSTR